MLRKSKRKKDNQISLARSLGVQGKSGEAITFLFILKTEYLRSTNLTRILKIARDSAYQFNLSISKNL
jgi:hypothetical protein